MNRDPLALSRALAAEAQAHAALVSHGGEGLCLPVTAALCRVLADLDVSDTHGVAGAYDGAAHWWVRVGEWIVDATRGQYDNGTMVSPVSDQNYTTEVEYPPGWTDEHVRFEALRVFQFEDIGTVFAEGLLGRLRLRARDFDAAGRPRRNDTQEG